MKLVNIYNDSESAIIIDEGSTDLTTIQKFETLGASPFNTTDMNENSTDLAVANLFFVEMNVYTEDESLLLKLNSAKPLLTQPSNGKFYFGDYHYHPPSQTYMVGKKHTAVQHESLLIERKNQIIPYPLEAKLVEGDFSTPKKFAIKMSEVIEILSNLENFTLDKNDKFFIEYGVFTDLFLQIKDEANTPGAGT